MEQLFWEMLNQAKGYGQEVLNHLEEYALEYFVGGIAVVALLVLLRVVWLLLPIRWKYWIMRRKGVPMMGKKARRRWVEQRIAMLWTEALIDDTRAGGLTNQEMNDWLRKAGRTLGIWDMVPMRRVCVHEPAEMIKQASKIRREQLKNQRIPFPDATRPVNKEVLTQRLERKVLASKRRRPLISKPKLA